MAIETSGQRHFIYLSDDDIDGLTLYKTLVKSNEGLQLPAEVVGQMRESLERLHFARWMHASGRISD